MGAGAERLSAPGGTKNITLIQLIHAKTSAVVATYTSFECFCGIKNIATRGPAPFAKVEVIPAPIPHGIPTP